MVTFDSARLQRIGDGPVATVYSGLHAGLPVALKVFPKRLDKRTLAVFNKEQAKLATVRRVTSILPLDGVDEMDTGELAVRMELCTQSLAALVDRVGPLPPADVVVLGRAMALALAAAHGAGVVHGGMSPHNVLFRTTGEPVLSDFGVTLRHAFARDPLYAIEFLPPETLRTGVLNESTDLYGLGAVLHYALAGRSPHPGRLGEQPGERVLRILGEPVPAINDSNVPVNLATLVARLLAADPARRLGDTAAVADQLGAMLPGAPQRPTVDDFDDFGAAPPHRPLPPAPPRQLPPPPPVFDDSDDIDDFAPRPYRAAPAPPASRPPIAPPSAPPPRPMSLPPAPPVPHGSPGPATPAASPRPTGVSPVLPVPPGAPGAAASAASPRPTGVSPVLPVPPGAPGAAASAASPRPTGVSPVLPVLPGSPGVAAPAASPAPAASVRPLAVSPALPVPPGSPGPAAPALPPASPLPPGVQGLAAPAVSSAPAQSPAPAGSPLPSAVPPVASGASVPAAGPVSPSAPLASPSSLEGAAAGSPLESAVPSAVADVSRPVAGSASAAAPDASALPPVAPGASVPAAGPVSAPGSEVSPASVLLPASVDPVVPSGTPGTPSGADDAAQRRALRRERLRSASVAPSGGGAQPVETEPAAPSPAPLPLASLTPVHDVPDAPDAMPTAALPTPATVEFPVQARARAVGRPDVDFDDDFPAPLRGRAQAKVLAGPLAPPGAAPKKLIRYDLLAGGAILLALLALVPLLLFRGEADEPSSVPHVPPAAGSGKGDVEIVLAEPVDLTDSVRLSWTADEKLDFVVVVAPEGQETDYKFPERKLTMTLPVELGLKYCFQVQATDGNDTYESNVVSLRNATCKE